MERCAILLVVQSSNLKIPWLLAIISRSVKKPTLYYFITRAVGANQLFEISAANTES